MRTTQLLDGTPFSHPVLTTTGTLSELFSNSIEILQFCSRWTATSSLWSGSLSGTNSSSMVFGACNKINENDQLHSSHDNPQTVLS